MTFVNMMVGVNELTEGDDLLVPHLRRARNCVHIGNPGLCEPVWDRAGGQSIAQEESVGLECLRRDARGRTAEWDRPA